MDKISIPEMAYTHSGIFHADDVCAYAFLSIINPQITLTRLTRVDQDVWDLVAQSPEKIIVFDIGGGKYDHHTKETIEYRDQENKLNPYSSFGKIVRDFWPYVLNNEKAYEVFDNSFVLGIDMQDASGSMWHGVVNTFSMSIGSFNGLWTEPQSDELQLKRFKKATSYAKEVILRYIARANSTAEADSIVLKALESKTPGAHHLYLDKYVPYASTLNRVNADVNWVIYPSMRIGWQIYAVVDLHNKDKQLIPEDMAERWRKDPDCIFVHPSGFTACFKFPDKAIKACIELDDLYDDLNS
jgi:uncharacterized UPF0160 family protein